MECCINLRRASSFCPGLLHLFFMIRSNMLSWRSSVSSHYFDLLVKFKNDPEHLFRNIQRNEYHNLFDFISGKGLKIMNLGGVQTTNGVASVLENADNDVVDPHLERMKNAAGGEESDEEDEDFVADKDDSGSPSDDSEDEQSDASESGGEKERPAKKEPKKEATGTKSSSSKKKSKEGDDEGSKKKRQKKKKDPNAPKRAMSGFMFFSNAEREETVALEHPAARPCIVARPSVV